MSLHELKGESSRKKRDPKTQENHRKDVSIHSMEGKYYSFKEKGMTEKEG